MNYSIENATLEKRLMRDLSIRDGKEMMHNISDLEACYDRQLPNIGCMIKESVGAERDLAKLFTKLLPVINHQTCTSYGMIQEHYGSRCYKLC